MVLKEYGEIGKPIINLLSVLKRDITNMMMIILIILVYKE